MTEVETADKTTMTEMVGPGIYRIVELSFGFQPEQFYQTKDRPLWIPLLANGYWADPGAYSTSEITKNSIMTKPEAERAVWLAKKINHDRGDGGHMPDLTPPVDQSPSG